MNHLHEYLKLHDRLLDHCRAHLTEEQWEAFARRVQGAPEGYSVEESWSPLDYVRYYWPKLSRWQQQAFLRQVRQARRREREEEAP